jgi:SAM-dependent methyltransferase
MWHRALFAISGRSPFRQCDRDRPVEENARGGSGQPEPCRHIYVCACGEAIPLRPNFADLIFISMAFHHFTQPQRVAQECAGVLREGGRLFLRTGCSENVSMYPYVPYFPSSRAL